MRVAVRRTWLASMIPALLWTCGVDEAADRDVTVRDSSGIRIVEYDGERTLPVVEPSLVWTYGHEVGDYGFQYVLSGALRGDGSAVVIDSGNREVVAIDPSGSSHTILAETGDGPAEVAQPREVVSADGDAVWVEDLLRKLMLFRGDSLASTVSVLGREDLSFAMPVGVDGRGRLLMTTGGHPYVPDPPLGWIYGHFTRLDPERASLDTLGTYREGRNTGEERVSAFGPYGVTTTTGYGFARAWTEIPALTWLDAEGGEIRIVRWEPTLAYPTDETRDRFEQTLRDELTRVNPQLQGDQLDEFITPRLNRYSFDPSVPLPLFGRIHGTPEGDVWLSDYEPGTLWPSGYTIVSGEGAWVARLEFPRPLLVLDIRNGLVLGVMTDDLEVRAIVLFRYREGSEDGDLR